MEWFSLPVDAASVVCGVPARVPLSFLDSLPLGSSCPLPSFSEPIVSTQRTLPLISIPCRPGFVGSLLFLG